MRRNRMEIIYDILKATADKGKIKPTHLLYKSNLSHKVMESYLKELLEKNMIEENKEKRGKTYSIKDKGIEFMNKFKNFVEFVDSFGLE